MRSLTRPFVALLLAAPALLTTTTCGGEGVRAPYVIAPDEDTGHCPSGAEALASTREALGDGVLSPLAPVAIEILVEDGGVRVLLPVLRLLLRELPPDLVLDVTEGYAEGRGLSRLVPHAVELLSYVEGTSPHIEGTHYGPIDATHAILTECDAIETLGALRRLLELEVVLDDGSRLPWLDVTFDALVAVASDPLFVALLEDIRFDGEDTNGEIAIGRDAFQLLARLISGNIASPNFDLAYTRGLVNDLMVSQLPEGEATRVNLNRLLDLLEMAVDPEADIFPHMQALMACVNQVDRESEIPGMLYDYLSIQELDFTVFLADLDRMGADPAGEAMRLALVDGARVLESEPRLARDAIAVLGRFLSPELSRTAIPIALDLRGTGVLTELLAVGRRLTLGCGGEAP